MQYYQPSENLVNVRFSVKRFDEFECELKQDSGGDAANANAGLHTNKTTKKKHKKKKNKKTEKEGLCTYFFDLVRI